MTLTATHRPDAPILLHGFKLSGHSHRAEMFLELLGLPYTFRQVDLAGGEHKTPAFLAKNAFGQVPVIEDGDTVVADSTAILVYLAQRYAPGRWIPADPAGQAGVQRWLSAASGMVAFGPCAARLVTLFNGDFNPAEVIARAHRLLKVMEGELAARDWLVGSAPTLADVAVYTYVAHAPEGNVSLDDYPHVRAWLARIEALPGFVAMPQSKVGLRA
ncbi:glutathione S-transferase family protein [Methyloversatilis universalis]|uniref:glutathione S-transferase family protein n=1 Tax=Methyloversatilis universalis TaxID=378211 RepID=UPI0003654CAB|nr:glutathione S-transferase [Methyloversatilis universalis]